MKDLNINSYKINYLYIRNVIELEMTIDQVNDLIRFSDMVSLDQLCSELYFKIRKFIKSID